MLLKEADLFTFFKACASENLGGIQKVVLPFSSENGNQERTFFGSFAANQNYALDSFRTVDPAKLLFYLPREKTTPIDFSPPGRLIAGIKACDFKALQLLDMGLANGDFVDPAYKQWRENSFIVTADCNEVCDTCHCVLVGGKPYVESGFDINLSRVDDSYFVQSGSQKGDQLMELLKKHTNCEEPTVEIEAKVEAQRKSVVERLLHQNMEMQRRDDEEVFRGASTDLWANESESCVGCGACTNVCPSCYCFILNDETEAEEFVKVRGYDSCQWNGYARVAGGGTPRPHMHQRFRNRYLCKFVFMKRNFGTVGCTGCGRCTDACPAKIDFRQVIKKLNPETAAV